MPDAAESARELHGWKEIASYLRISVRNAQLMEKDRGLPVRRGAGPKAAVFAYAGELDAWRRAGTEPAGTTQEDQRRRFLLLGGAALAAVSGIGLNRALRSRPADVSNATIVGNALCAWSSDGELLWKYPFSETLNLGAGALAPGFWLRRRVRVIKFSPHSEQRVVFAAIFENAYPQDRCELYCFSSKGELLWRYRPEFAVTFGGEKFDGPWVISDVVFVPGSPKPMLYLTVHHDTWRPGFVVGLDPEGRATVEFANAGNLYMLEYVSGSGGNYILAGGVNNEYNAAALAVLKAGAAPSISPQTRGTRFEIGNGPTGAPERYFLFPPSELNTAAGNPYSNVKVIREDGGRILIFTDEVTILSDGWGIYIFGSSLEPEYVTYGEGYALCHRQLQREGKVNHDFDLCPELGRPVRVRRWDARSDWTTVEVPYASNVGPGGRRGAHLRPPGRPPEV